MNIFDFNSINDFDKHILFSIPNYEQLFTQVKEYVEVYSQQGTSIVDVGCSTGKLLTAIDKLKAYYVGIDSSTLIPSSTDTIKFIKDNALLVDLPSNVSVMVSMFFLQFLSRGDRAIMLKRVKDSLLHDGVFIVSEKTHFIDPRLEALNNATYLEWKRSNFSDTEILDKSAKLTRSMWLSTSTELYQELCTIGTPILFWKSFAFEAYIVLKK